MSPHTHLSVPCASSPLLAVCVLLVGGSVRPSESGVICQVAFRQQGVRLRLCGECARLAVLRFQHAAH